MSAETSSAEGAAGHAPPKRALLIVNGKSRSGHGDSAEEAAEALRRAGVEPRPETCGDREALLAAIDRAAGSVDAVVLGGGDGTMNSAAPALLRAGLPLGVLPLGTANDLARTLGLPTDLEGAVGVVAAGHRRRIDLGEVNGRPFFNVASLGLSAEVTRELTREVKRRWGRLGYAVATLRALARARPFAAELRSDGAEGPRILRSLQIAVGNGRHYGGGMTVEAEAEIDDGRLDLYSIDPRRLWKLALVYPLFRWGKHDWLEQVRTLSFSEAEIRTRRPMPVNADGEIVTETPARFRLLRGAVTVFAPERG